MSPALLTISQRIRHNFAKIPGSVDSLYCLKMAILSFILMFLSEKRALCRPVAFVGGTSIMNDNAPEQFELSVNHTPDRQFSLGFTGLFWRSASPDGRYPRDYYLVPEVNALLLRNNLSGNQTNLYASVGFGIAHFEKSTGENLKGTAWAVSFDADTETRDWYFSASTSFYKLISDRHKFQSLKARAGLAPFTAAMGGLHIFAILEAEWKSKSPANDFGPLLRFSHQNVLWELGVSARSRFKFNWMVEI